MQISAEKNYYKILGIAPHSKPKEIKKRYRELAKKHHPDTNKGSKKAEENFKLISEAYSVLSDSKKRKQYDRIRVQTQRAAQSHSRPYSQQQASDFDFGYKYQRQEPRGNQQDPFSNTGFEEEVQIDPDWPTRGFDLQFFIEVPFVTAALGGEMPFHYEKQIICESCDGTGKNEEDDECPICNGSQRVVKQVSLKVDIPSGIADQYTLRIPNEGGAGRNGGPPGDLMLKIDIQVHPHFKKLKKDIYAEVSISPELASKGGPLKVETLDTIQTISVEEGTLTGEEYRIPGAGSTDPWGKKRGDFIVKFHISDQ